MDSCSWWDCDTSGAITISPSVDLSVPFSSSYSRPTGILDLFPVGPEPNTELGRYRILSPKAGVRVSPLCLGAMSLGDQWAGWMGGKLNAEESEGLLDAF